MSGPPAHIRMIGRAMTWTIGRFPSTWPLFRGYTTRFFGRAAPGWEERTGRPDRMAPLEAAIELVGAEPGRILDQGTGTGFGARWLAERFPAARVTGADLAPEMVEQARATLPAELAGRVEFTVADASDPPFAAGSFDLITQVSVPAFYTGTARILAPGGHLVVVSSLGPRTPMHTPSGLLHRGFEREGLEWVGDGAAGTGTYYVLRKPG